MVFTLYKDGTSDLTNLLDVYNCLCYPIGRTLRPSVECPGGTFYPSGGQFALVQNVRGDNPPSHNGIRYIRLNLITKRRGCKRSGWGGGGGGGGGVIFNCMYIHR